MVFRKKQHRIARGNTPIDPDEIFLDAHNQPEFDTHHMEGRFEKALPRATVVILGIVFLFIGGVFGWKVWQLQVVNGATYRIQSEENRLERTILFPQRGVIFDRTGTPLAWNEAVGGQATTSKTTFLQRTYSNARGLAHLLGFVSYPKQDGSGVYYQEELVGQDGVEKQYDSVLAGQNGARLTEKNALNDNISSAVVASPQDGANLSLTIDARVQEALYNRIASLANSVGFQGGAGVLMDAASGELIALTSFPQYESQLLTDGGDENLITALLNDARTPFLNRAVSGRYTPGSIIKPFIAAGALAEGVVSPETKIFSSGALTIPNPYDETRASVFNDWKAHGWVDIRDALAVSSNIYFFEVGGGLSASAAEAAGLAPQEGIGIEGITRYVSRFGIGEKTGIDMSGDTEGTIPSPRWKAEVFPGDPWRVGDTYNTAIGQYGFQVTPLQMARATAAIANGGLLVTPHVLLDQRTPSVEKVAIPSTHLAVVREGMRQAVTGGTAGGLFLPHLPLGAKTGTAEVGIEKKQVNSWVIGFFPYDEPHYVFAVVMEHGPSTNLIGATFVMRELLEWMLLHTPEYFK